MSRQASDPAYSEALAAFQRAYVDPKHSPFHAEGGPAAALLIHGFPGTPAEMRPLAETLVEDGWTVDVPLLPGFGTTIDTLFERDYREWLDAARAGFHRLAQKQKPVLLIGHSMGGAVALRTAADVKPDGLVLLAPFWRLPLDNPILRLLSPVLQLLIRRVKPFNAVDLDMEEVRVGIKEFMPHLDLNDPDIRHQIQDFTVPTRLFVQLDRLGRDAFRAAADYAGRVLILQGADDELVSPVDTRRLLERLRGPIEYEELAATHDLVDETGEAWPRVKESIRSFANRLAE